MTYADLLFTGGTVHTVDAAGTRAGTLAVRDGRIVAVGGEAGELRGPRTEVVDLAGPPVLPGQSLDLATAPTAYTAAGAYVNHRDDSGSLRPGNVADLVVLDRDPFDRPVSATGETSVAETYVAGRPVYRAA